MVASRKTEILLAAIFLTIIAGGGTVQTFVELHRGERPQVLELFGQSPTQQHLRAFEQRLEKRAWPAVMSRPAMQYVQFALHNNLGEKAVAGYDGWLFYRPGVDFLIDPWPLPKVFAPVTDDPIPAIVAFRDALAARGTRLLVVPAPGKAGVYPGRLSSRDVHKAGDVHAHVHALMQRFDEEGIAYVDLFQVFDDARAEHPDIAYYLAQDTHWSPDGVRLAASAVAARILDEGWVKGGTVQYRHNPVPITRTGDVLRMVNSEAITASFPPETITCSQVIEDASGEPYSGDPHSPVLVLGDSFLRIYQSDEPGAAGFIAHLASELKRPLASIVSDGGASTLVRQDLQRHPEMLQGKRLVIWEFVERDLRFAMEGWKIVPLPNGAS